MPRRKYTVTPAKRLEQCNIQIGCDCCGRIQHFKDLLALFEAQTNDSSIPNNEKFGNLLHGRLTDFKSIQNTFGSSYLKTNLRPTNRNTQKAKKIVKRGRKPWTVTHSQLLKGCLKLFGDEIDKIKLFLPDFNDATIRKKISLLGWKKYVLVDRSTKSNEASIHPEISQSDNNDFITRNAPLSSSSGSKIVVPQPSLAQTLLKITSIDMDGNPPEIDLQCVNMSSLCSFDFSKQNRYGYPSPMARIPMPPSTNILREAINRFTPFIPPNVSPATLSKQIKIDDSIFRVELSNPLIRHQNLALEKNPSIDSLTEIPGFTFNLAGVNKQTSKNTENKMNTEKYSSFVRFSSLVDFYAGERPENNF